MYEHVPPSDPQAQRVHKLVEAVLKPFAADQKANPESPASQSSSERQPAEFDREE